MARRSGKAISRRERQRRRAQQAGGRPGAARPIMPSAPEPESAAGSPPATQATATPGPVASASRPRTSELRFSASGPSRLSERAVAEYHYVGRDLRNIGVLVVVLAVLMAVAAVAVTALGITPT